MYLRGFERKGLVMTKSLNITVQLASFFFATILRMPGCERTLTPVEPILNNLYKAYIDSVAVPDTVLAPKPFVVYVKGWLPDPSWKLDHFALEITQARVLIIPLMRKIRSGRAPELPLPYSDSVIVRDYPLASLLNIEVIGANKKILRTVPVKQFPLWVAVEIKQLPVMGPFDAYRFTLRFGNRGQSPIELHFATSQIYDFLVYDRNGKLLYQWSADKAFAQVAWTMKLLPQEERSYSEAWIWRYYTEPPYKLTGKLVSTPGDSAVAYFERARLK